MSLGYGDDIRTHVQGYRFDMPRHRGRIRHLYLSGIDLALGCLVDDSAEKMAAIGKMIRRRYPRKGILRDCIVIPVEKRFAQFTALIFRMRRLIHIDIHHRSHYADRPSEIRWRRDVGLATLCAVPV